MFNQPISYDSPRMLDGLMTPLARPKAPMFSFQRLSGSDPHVGVEMQSTGEAPLQLRNIGKIGMPHLGNIGNIGNIGKIGNLHPHLLGNIGKIGMNMGSCEVAIEFSGLGVT